MATFTTSYEPQKALKMIFDFSNGDILGALVKNGEDKGGLNYTLTSETKRPEVQIAYEEFLIRATAYQDLTLVSPCVNRLVVDTNQIADYETIEEGAFYISQAYINLIYRDDYHALLSSLPTVTQLMGFIYKDTNGDIHTIAPNNLVYTQNPASIINTSGASQSYPFDFFGFSNKYYKGANAKMSATYKIFKDKGGAIKYLNTGDDSGEIGDDTKEVAERNIDTLYLKSTVYRSATSSRTQAVKVESHRWEFDVQRYTDDGKQIAKWNRGVIGFVNDTNTGHYNLGFMENTATKNIVKIRVDGVEVPKTSFSWLTGLTTYTENTKDVIEDQTYFYWSDISTNMYIFDTLYHAQQVIEGIEEGIVKMFEGDDLTNTHLNNNDLDFNTDMSDCFVLDQHDVQELAKRFNAYVTASGDIVSDLFVGMAMHENPIDCNIDLFEMPIDVSGFCETEHYLVKFSPSVTPPTPESGGHSTE